MARSRASSRDRAVGRHCQRQEGRRVQVKLRVGDRKSTRLNSSHSLHDALPIFHTVPFSLASTSETKRTLGLDARLDARERERVQRATHPIRRWRDPGHQAGTEPLADIANDKKVVEYK